MSEHYHNECKDCGDFVGHWELENGLCRDCRGFGGEVMSTDNPDVLSNSKMTGTRTVMEEIISAKLPTQIEPQTQGE